MKKIALISSFCDNKEKINLLYDNVFILKELGIDVIIFTPFILTEEINKIADYILISKENPILDWPEKALTQWTSIKTNDNYFNMSVTTIDYGFAALNQIKRMADLALSMDYDLFFPMIYDININEYVKSILKNNKKNSFFPSIRDGHVWSIGLHLISLDREHLTRFKNLITKESYLKDLEGDAFTWTYKAIDFVPGVLEKEPVEDLIYYFKDINFFNFSIIEEIKCFIHKVENQDIKFIFYDFNEIKTFIIKTEDFTQEYNVKEWEEIKLPYKEYISFIVIYEEKEYDFTSIINKIKHNIFTKTII
jgi:hypothetical protein